MVTNENTLELVYCETERTKPFELFVKKQELKVYSSLGTEFLSVLFAVLFYLKLMCTYSA